MSFEEPNDPRSSEIGNNQIQLTELTAYEERTPVGLKWCLGSCFHHYFVVLDDIIKSVINNNIWVWDNDNCHYWLISIVFFTGWFNFIVLFCVFLVEWLTWLHWLTCIYPVLQVCICWKWVLQGRMPLTPTPQSHGRGRALHVIPLVPGEV